MFKDKKTFNYIYWLIIILFTILCLYLLIKIIPLYGFVFRFVWKLLVPFLIACLIAYLLFPIMRKLEDHRIHKIFAILFIYLVFLGGSAYSFYIGYPTMLTQLKELNEHLPQLIEMYEELIAKLYESTSFLPESVHDQMDRFIVRIETSLEDLVGKMMESFTKLFDVIILVTVIPVLVFYFLKDYDKIKAYIMKLIPHHYYPKISRLAHAIDGRLGGYIRGQLLVSLFISLATLIVFQIVDLDYSFLLAIVIGLTNIIPYFGPIIGAIPAVMIALTISTKMVVIVIVTVFVVQIIESNFLSPYIVGKSINVHPIAIIFALLLGGQLAGVLGMIVAVPFLTIAKEIITHFVILRESD